MEMGAVKLNNSKAREKNGLTGDMIESRTELWMTGSEYSVIWLFRSK